MFGRKRGESPVGTANQERLQLFWHAVSSVPDFVVITDLKGNILFANQSILTRTGYRDDEVIGRHVTMLLSPNYPPGHWRAAHEATLQGSWSGELLDITKDGREFRIFLTSSAVRDENGNTIAAVGISREVTDAQGIENSLRATQEFLVSLLEHTPASIYVISADDRFLLVNDAWEKSTGRRREDILGCKRKDVFPPDVARQFRDTDLTVFNTRGPVTVEQLVEAADGLHFYQTVKFPLRDRHGTIEAIAGVSFDITNRRRTELALRESEERYRRLVETCPEAIVVQSEGRFEYVNAAAVKLFGAFSAEELIGKPILDFVHPDQRGIVTKRIEQMLRDGKPAPLQERKILQLGGKVIDAEVTGVAVTYQGKPAIQGVLRDITKRKLVEQALIREYDLLHALMDQIPDTIYFKDTASRFTRINTAQAQFLGLADPKDALGKTDANFFTPEFARESFADEQSILTSGKTLINKVEKVTRLDGQSRWFSVTKAPILDKQGQITGIVGISREIAPQKMPAGGAPPETPARHLATILLVEDDQNLRDLQSQVLELEGFRVITASDGEEGLMRYCRFAKHIDLVVTDVTMPKLTGDAMIAEIKKVSPSVKIIVVSGYAKGDIEARLRDQKVSGIVDKPFDTSMLVQACRQVLNIPA
jgi:PAS domain S-box-containing protein